MSRAFSKSINGYLHLSASEVFIKKSENDKFWLKHHVGFVLNDLKKY